MTARCASAGIAFWAVASDEIDQVIEFFPHSASASATKMFQ